MTASRTRPTAPRRSDPNLLPALAMAAVGSLTLPAVMGVVAATTLRPDPVVETVGFSDQGDLDVRAVALGGIVFADSCAACHAPDGTGVPGLGKPLRNSAYVQGSDDDSLFRLVAEGRGVSDELNTTGALMPPRGARGLTDPQVRDVVQYLRSLQNPAEPTVSMEAWIVEPAVAMSAETLAGLPGHGDFIASCSACHGVDARGIEGLALPLAGSAFVNGLDDNGLMNFIKQGRPVWDPESKTGVDMPPKGGNPALDDVQLRSIVAFIRAVNEPRE